MEGKGDTPSGQARTPTVTHAGFGLGRRIGLALRYCISDGVPIRSLKVAAVVGTALNLINQSDAIFGSASIHWLRLLLTFAMPYAVSTYGAVSFRMGQQSATAVPRPCRRPESL